MTTKQLLTQIIKDNDGITQETIGKFVGLAPNHVSRKFKIGSMRVGEFFKIADGLGLEIRAVLPKTGRAIEFERDEDGNYTSRSVVESTLRWVRMYKSDVARLLGWQPADLWQRLIRDSVKMDDLMKMWEVTGVEVTYYMDGKPVVVTVHREGHGKPASGRSDYVKYDTKDADAVANTFYADGVNEYGADGTAQELYRDNEGRYFMVEYSSDPEVKPRIKDLPESIAAAVIAMYGTEIEKGPREEKE